MQVAGQQPLRSELEFRLFQKRAKAFQAPLRMLRPPVIGAVITCSGLRREIGTMSDIVFDDSEQITVLCSNLKVQGHDLLLDSYERRTEHNTALRRALVHDQNDGL